MELNIIGAHGGVTRGYSATSYLIDQKLLIDAGSMASALDIRDQLAIDNILISHPHLDHIKDLAFICDNCFGLKSEPFQVYCHKTVEKAIKDHLFNDTIWPDFSVLPNKENPTMIFNNIKSEEVLKIGGYNVTPVHVNHPGDALGFIVEKDDVAIAFTQDTNETDRIWEVAKTFKNLKAIFTEVSFPNSMQKVADISNHHTPQSLYREIPKMPKNVPIYLGHLKPNYQEQLIREVNDLNESRLHVMFADDVRYSFE